MVNTPILLVRICHSFLCIVHALLNACKDLVSTLEVGCPHATSRIVNWLQPERIGCLYAYLLELARRLIRSHLSDRTAFNQAHTGRSGQSGTTHLHEVLVLVEMPIHGEGAMHERQAWSSHVSEHVGLHSLKNLTCLYSSCRSRNTQICIKDIELRSKGSVHWFLSMQSLHYVVVSSE